MTDVATPAVTPAPAPTVESLQAQLAALQAAHDAANPTPEVKTDLITRFKQLADAGVHVVDRVRVLADEGYAKVSSTEGIVLELLDALVAKVNL